MAHTVSGKLREAVLLRFAVQYDKPQILNICGTRALPKFERALKEINSARTDVDRLIAVDTVFNIVHGLGSAAGRFVEGSKDTLDSFQRD